MANEITVGAAFVGLVISILVQSIVIHLAAKIVLDRASFGAALVVALIASFAAQLARWALPGVWGLIAGVAAWGLVAAIAYRTKLLRALVVGLVAALLWAGINWLVRQWF